MHLVSGSASTSSWIKAALTAVGLAMLLAGCVTSGDKPQRAQLRNNGDDRKTASDQTDADRLAGTRMELAAGYLGRGQPTDALDQVKLALQASPNNPNAWSLRGLIYGALGDADKADESFRRALQLAPHEADIMHNYAWFMCQQRRYPEAEAQFARAMAEPGYRSVPRTLLAQGVCQARAGRGQDAERTLTRAYELDPANPTTAVNLAEILYRNAQYERARFYVRRVNGKPELMSAQTLWLAARIEHKLGRDQQVQELGEQLHKRFSQSPESLLFEKGKFDE
jgi:type IV pilus assembly protein PilF